MMNYKFALDDVEDSIFTLHGNLKISEMLAAGGIHRRIHPIHCKADLRINAFLKSVHALYPLRGLVIRNAQEMAALEDFYSATAETGKLISSFKAEPENAELLKVASCSIRELMLKCMRFAKFDEVDAAILRFDEYIEKMQKLTMEDFTDHVVRFGVVTFRKAGSNRIFKSQGRYVEEIHRFGREVSLAAPYKDAIFAWRPEALDAFNEVSTDFEVFRETWSTFTAAPSLQMTEPLVAAMRKYMISLYSFIHPKRGDAPRSPEAKRQRVESIGKADESIVEDSSQTRFDLAPSPTAMEAFQSLSTDVDFS